MMMTAENKEKQNFFFAKDVARIVGTKETPLGFVASLPLTRESAVCVRILALLDDDDLFCALDLVNQPTAHCRRRSGKKNIGSSRNFPFWQRHFEQKEEKKRKDKVTENDWTVRPVTSAQPEITGILWNEKVMPDIWCIPLSFNWLENLPLITFSLLPWPEKKKQITDSFFFDIHSTRSIQGFHTNMTHCGIPNDSEGEPVEILLYTTS